MRRGDKVYIKLDDKKHLAIFLGQGDFSKAYLIQTNKGPYVITYGDDCTKEVIALWGDKSNPHVPKIWRYDTNIYLMPYYKPLTKEYRVAWNQYITLKKVLEAVRRSYINRVGINDYRKDDGYRVIDEFITFLCSHQKNINSALCDALKDICDTCTNCGSNIMFEFAPRNLGVDNKGRLVLRDIVFLY